MTAYPISTDSIFEKILESNACANDRYGRDDHCAKDNVKNLARLDKILFQNGATGTERYLKSYENFEKLVLAMTNGETVPVGPRHRTFGGSALHAERTPRIEPHDWSVHGNYFTMKIRPFVRVCHYDAVSAEFDFEEFVQNGDANHAEQAGDYVYWPNVVVSYFGWRMFLKRRTGVDIGVYLPLIGHRALGNVNLFVFKTEYFVNVELAMTVDDLNLFVNGASLGPNFVPSQHDDLFYITMTNGRKGVCKIIDKLVYSKKDIFEYITDDIHLETCRTSDKYADCFEIDPKGMRTFEDKMSGNTGRLPLDCNQERVNKITPSSEYQNLIKACIEEAVTKISQTMQEALSKLDDVSDKVDDCVLTTYFDKSEFINFDYLIIVVWKHVRKEKRFDYCETDIKLYMNMLCDTLFGHRPGLLQRANDCCEPYFQLTKQVYKKFCASLTFFTDGCVELAHYYAVHYMIYSTQKRMNKRADDLWRYTLDNAVQSGVDESVLCNGYVKKITIQNTHSIFNGKHYTVVKKDDDLFKITEKTTAYNVSNLKFNNWKYLYLTEQGVFNVIKMKYHDSCPFIVGNCLIKSFVNRDENEFASRGLIDYMLSNIEYEVPILKAYHVAKVARDMKVLKKNVAMLNEFNTCANCKTTEKLKLNKLFREIWNMDQHEFVMLGVYLNVHKMHDLKLNLRCADCTRQPNERCLCLTDADIDFRAFKIALVYNLLFENFVVIEIAWALLYDMKRYNDTLKYALADDEKVASYVDAIQQNRVEIIERLHDKFDRTDYIFDLIECSNDVNAVVQDFLGYADAACTTDKYKPAGPYEPYPMPRFFEDFFNTLSVLNKWGVWWDKLIVARPGDDLSKWLARFYTRIVMSKVDTQNVSPYFLKMIVQGYLYFRVFTNFNTVNSLVMMHFTASLAIPTDYEKLCIYLNGESNCGKSSFFDLLDTIIVAHKRDSASYTTTKRETDEMEANKLISQLYVINEMKECNDAFFKNSADSSKSNSVCRKYEGSQKYEANYKLLIVNNKPLCIRDYDKGVRNRFCVVYMKHVFVEDMPFSGSAYDHYKASRYPMEKSYYENLKNSVRIFASHILKYKRNPRDGYVYYKYLVMHDSIHDHNLMCLDLNNHPFSALSYVLRVEKKPGAYIDEASVNPMILEALPHLEKFCHTLLKRSYNEHNLGTEFRNTYAKYYRASDKVYEGLSMARSEKEFNLYVPSFKC